MPTQAWYVILAIVLTVCGVIVINALGDAGAFNFISWKGVI